MEERLYEITNQTRYEISYKEVENIEDVEEAAYNTEEMIELFGHFYCYGGSGTITLKHNVISDVNEVMNQIREGKKTVVCTNDELIDFLKNCGYPISHFVDGIRRTGNRFSYHSKKDVVQTKVKYSDWTTLVRLFESLWEGVDMNVKISNTNREKFVIHFKSMVSWEKCVEKLEFLGTERGKFVKMLYDNPELINKK